MPVAPPCSPLAGGLASGFFNVSLHAIDSEHRGDAYWGLATTQHVDVATGQPFMAEVLPRITGVVPRVGSLAGGADLTICARPEPTTPSICSPRAAPHVVARAPVSRVSRAPHRVATPAKPPRGWLAHVGHSCTVAWPCARTASCCVIHP